MNNRGKLIIIPNENEILQMGFEREIEEGKSHTTRIQEFSDIYNLGFQFTEEDYQTAPCDIAALGHLVIKTEDEVSLVVLYMPERITDRQYNWLYQNKEMLNSYVQVSANAIQTIIESDVCWKKLHGIEEIMHEAGRKNLMTEKGRGI